MKRVLLMSITNKDEWLSKLQDLREIYRPIGKIFVFRNRMDDEDDRIWITFNTDSEYRFITNGVLRVNRNKDTSTLFTIDAVNALSIREKGIIDKGFVPNWREYENCLIINNREGFNVIPLVIHQTYELR